MMMKMKMKKSTRMKSSTWLRVFS